MNDFKHVFLSLGLLLMTAGVVKDASAQDGNSTPVSPCESAEARQFDFWIGEWELNWGDTGRGTNIITSELGRCVIEENFTTINEKPFVGHSLSVYNPRIGKWQQTWVDNNGAYLELIGEFQDGKMTLARETTNKEGKLLQQRMVFSEITEKSLQWDWESSTDGGHTWKTVWAISYKRK